MDFRPIGALNVVEPELAVGSLVPFIGFASCLIS